MSDQRRALLLVFLGPQHKIHNTFSQLAACCCSYSPTQTAWLIVVKFSDVGSKKKNCWTGNWSYIIILYYNPIIGHLLGPTNEYMENIWKFSLPATCSSSTQTAWLIVDKFSDVGSKKMLKYRQQAIYGTSGKKLTSRNTKGCLCGREKLQRDEQPPNISCLKC